MYYGVYYEEPGILVVMYAMAILVGLSVIEGIYRLVTNRCYVEVPISMAEIGKPVEVIIRTHNRGLFPGGRVRVFVRVKNPLKKKSQKQCYDLSGVPVGHHQHVFKVVPDEAGAYDIEILRIRLYSLFGLVSFSKKSKDRTSFCILPEMHSTSIRVKDSTRNFQGEADVYDDFRGGEDPSETFEIREYREKDKLQNIHWKLSAKADELMVKENSRPRACGVVLMVDLRREHRGEDAAEVFLELVASVSFSLLDQECPHFVAWLSRETLDVRRIRVDDEESFYLFLNYFLKDIDSKSVKDVRKEYRKKFRNEVYLHDVTLGMDLEISKDGQRVIQWDMKKLESVEDECGKLELLL